MIPPSKNRVLYQSRQGKFISINTKCKKWLIWITHPSVLYGDKEGNKSLTKDRYLATFKSISKADPDGGLIKSVAEKRYPELGNNVFWIPNGSLIFSSDVSASGKNKGTPRIIMWEKNCLRHGEFDLPKGVTAVNGLTWNTSSKILAVHVVENSNSHSLLIYIRNNYKWFLKNRISLSSDNLPVHMSWSSKQKSHLLILTQRGHLERLAFRETFVIGPVRDDEAKISTQSLALIVDGNALGVTPLSKYTVAPPLTHFAIKYPVENDWTVVETTSCEGLICSLLRSGSGQERLFLTNYQFDQKLTDALILTDFQGATRGQLRTRMLQLLNLSTSSNNPITAYKLSYIQGTDGEDTSLSKT